MVKLICEKSGLPPTAAISGVSRSLTRPWTTLTKAAPRTMPTAIAPCRAQPDGGNLLQWPRRRATLLAIGFHGLAVPCGIGVGLVPLDEYFLAGIGRPVGRWVHPARGVGELLIMVGISDLPQPC